MSDDLYTLFKQARARFETHHFGSFTAMNIAEAVAITLNEVQKEPIGGTLMGVPDEAARVREYGRVLQTAEEICVAMEWPLEDLLTLINWYQHCLNEGKVCS